MKMCILILRSTQLANTCDILTHLLMDNGLLNSVLNTYIKLLNSSKALVLLHSSP